MMLVIINTSAFINTIVGPTGNPKTMDTQIPKTAIRIEDMATKILIVLKDRQIFTADIVGNTIRAQTKRDPTSRKDIEIVSAIIIASMRFNFSKFSPLALA